MYILLSETMQTNHNNRKILNWNTFISPKYTKLWNSLLTTEDLECDLKGIDVFSSDGLIWLQYLFLYRKTRNKKTFIILPENEKHLGYLRFLGFDRYFDALNVEVVNDYLLHLAKFEYITNDSLFNDLRRTVLVTGQNWGKVYTHIIPALKEYVSRKVNLPLNKDITSRTLDPFALTMRELLANIAYHGGSEGGNGIGLISFTPQPSKLGLIRLCFSDIGDGFKTSFERKHKILLSDEKEAIFQGLLFRYFYKEEGIYGLYDTLRYIRIRNGVFGIKSKGTLVKIDLSDSNVQNEFDKSYGKPSIEWIMKLSKSSNCSETPGTHIFVELQ